ELLLRRLGPQTRAVRNDPHLDELHLLRLRVVALRVLRAAPEPHALRATRSEHAAVAEAVRVLELAGDDPGDPLDVAVRMHRPHRARDERVVIKDAHRADTHVARVAVTVEGEVPARTEPAAVDRIDRGVRTVHKPGRCGHSGRDGTRFAL